MNRAAPLLLLALAAPAQQPSQSPVDSRTEEVFRRYAGQVVKIEVSETESAAKAEVGSAFFVTADGRLITNYHVVAEMVLEPERYRAVLIDAEGDSAPVRVLAIDVVHDLAVVHSGRSPARWFEPAALSLAQGTRLYGLGHPFDEGIAIVEGTYNGTLPHTLYPRIRFTGALNPGMSGGPAITADGRVAGINVSTAGNEVSYLVPVANAAALLARTSAGNFAPSANLLAEAARQIRAYQDEYLRGLLDGETPTVTLGKWTLPTQPAGFFDCWADAVEEDEHQPWRETQHYCSSDDDIFVSAEVSSGVIEFEHRLFTSEALDRFRFHAMYTREFQSDWHTSEAGADDVTDFACTESHVRNAGQTFLAVFCARRYVRLAGLYDAVFRLASTGEPRRGLLTTMTMSGVSFANAKEMARRYIDRIGAASAAANDGQAAR